jgi:hypothetical protein
MSILLTATHLSRTQHGRRVVRRALALTAASGLLVVAAQLPAAAAPGDQSTDTVEANVGVTSAISLTGLTPSFRLNGLPGATVEGLNAVGYTVTTNNVGGYTVTVQADGPTLDPAGASTDTIPIANLGVRAGDTGAYTALSDTGAVTLRDQNTRSASGGDDYADDYQVDIPFVADDVYSATLTYVATAS